MKPSLKKIRTCLFTVLVLTPSLFFINCSSEDKGINIFTVDQDKTLGLQVAHEIDSDKANYPVLSESLYPAAYKFIRHVRDTILSTGQVQHKADFPWDVYIINKDVLNAFCTPGGHIYFYSGLIKFLENEAQFAGVMGHEMAHAARRHSTEQLTKVYGLNVLLQVVLGQNQGLISQIAATLLVLQFSRSNETDADEYSVRYLYPTDYDATGAAGFFQRMAAADSSKYDLSFLSTHPADKDRITNITKQWQSLGGKTGQTFETRYNQFKTTLP
jgi:beta-barrel assembly-enhancing protease